MKFKVSGFISIPVYKEVDADSAEEAIEKAETYFVHEIKRGQFHATPDDLIDNFTVLDENDNEVEV